MMKTNAETLKTEMLKFHSETTALEEMDRHRPEDREKLYDAARPTVLKTKAEILKTEMLKFERVNVSACQRFS